MYAPVYGSNLSTQLSATAASYAESAAGFSSLNERVAALEGDSAAIKFALRIAPSERTRAPPDECRVVELLRDDDGARD